MTSPQQIARSNALVYATYPTAAEAARLRNSVYDYCYIAGPMTGFDHFNYPAFDAARDLLVGEGWAAISPADLDRINLGIDFSVMTGKEHLGHLSTAFARQDIASLLIADAVFLLDGWQKSTGATNEARIATMLGVPVYELSGRCEIVIDARFSNVPVAAQ